MSEEDIKIRLTKHASDKIKQRQIAASDIREIILRPELIEKDKFDDSLTHFIGYKNERFLRIIGKYESNKDFMVISAFYDRRLKRRKA